MTKPIMPAAFAASLLAATIVTAPPVFAEEQAARISVTGEGEARVSPDMAVLNLSVLREAETARAALDANNEAMTAVISAMKEDGIEPRDLQTGGLSIQPRYIHPNDKNGEERPRIVGYEVTNSLTVRIRDLSMVGAVLDRSVSLGVNQGGGLSFTNEDPSATLTEARRQAMKDAVAKATTLAEEAGVKLGKVITISEQSGGRPPRPLAMAARADMAMEAVPVEAGENSYHVQVSVTFELDQ